jgi:hypothetical protein
VFGKGTVVTWGKSALNQGTGFSYSSRSNAAANSLSLLVPPSCSANFFTWTSSLMLRSGAEQGALPESFPFPVEHRSQHTARHSRARLERLDG